MSKLEELEREYKDEMESLEEYHKELKDTANELKESLLKECGGYRSCECFESAETLFKKARFLQKNIIEKAGITDKLQEKIIMIKARMPNK